MRIPSLKQKAAAFLFLATIPLIYAASPRINKTQGYWEYDTYTFSGPKGQWNNANAWQNKKIPPSRDIVEVWVTGGATLTISQKTPTLARLRAGAHNTQKSVIHIKDGAKIEGYALSIPLANQKNGQALIEMEGGLLSIGTDIKNNGVISIGNQGTTYSGKAEMIVSGGKIQGAILVGNDAPKTNEGTLRIEGSEAEISGPELPNYASNYFALGASGTLEFILDEKGVSTLNFGESISRLADGATIRVDGKKYKGTIPRTIPLLTAGKIEKGNVKVECVNFLKGNPEVLFSEKSMVLKLSK